MVAIRCFQLTTGSVFTQAMVMLPTSDFEIIYVVRDLDGAFDPRIEAMEHVDAVFESHAGLNLATLTVEGHTRGWSAAFGGANLLKEAGFEVVRTYPDMVDRAEIAERAQVTRQAVGNWARGERHGDTYFPSPVNLASGGLWLWKDVADWLRGRQLLDDDGLDYPSLSDHAHVDAMLSSIRSMTLGTVHAKEPALAPRVMKPIEHSAVWQGAGEWTLAS